MDEKILTILKEHTVGKAPPTCYEVYFTTEGVMVVFGVFNGQHKQALKEFIDYKTNNTWIEDIKLAEEINAQFVMGLPAQLDRLKQRLAD